MNDREGWAVWKEEQGLMLRPEQDKSRAPQPLQAEGGFFVDPKGPGSLCLTHTSENVGVQSLPPLLRFIH